jgi:hypothetical protein
MQEILAGDTTNKMAFLGEEEGAERQLQGLMK